MDSIKFLSPFTQIYIISLIGIIGLVVGSFLNVAALRLLSGESLVFPRSKCPKCNTQIAWYDNIPVLSYILLGAKCRHCKKYISIQYPAVEITTAVLFISIFYLWGFSLKTLFLIVFSCALVVITITDIKEKVIFDITSIPLIPLGLIYNFFDLGNSGEGLARFYLAGINHSFTINDVFISAIIGTIIGALFFEIFSRFGLIVGEYAFGGGDTIIGAFLGAWFGWKLLLFALVISLIAQTIVGLPLILYNMYKDKDYKSIIFTFVLISSMFVPYLGQSLGLTKYFTGAILTILTALGLALAGIVVILKRLKDRQSFTFLPFGPALVVGGFAVMFWGPQLINWYTQIL